MFEAGVLNGLTRISVEIGSSKSRSDDDFIDRVNHSYSTTILMLCTLIVLSRQFIGKPMSCWTPNEFTGSQEEYATMLCWVTSTYFISPKEPAIPSDLSVRRKDSVHYYQWVPFLLMFQAALFSVPCIVWRLLNWQSRLHVSWALDILFCMGNKNIIDFPNVKGRPDYRESLNETYQKENSFTPVSFWCHLPTTILHTSGESSIRDFGIRNAKHFCA
ncbi:Innexin, partial [Opisthorchis viverrini]